ncbi:MAG TPA: universal stress protein [Acidimicrobiia bacterium]|nr:universal stress protein [Acidimicrobiia bacterium]
MEIASIIAGIDLSPIGRRVADRGRIVAEASGQPLDLVHVLESLNEAMIPGSLAKLADRHRQESVRETAEWVRGRTDVPVELHLAKGSPSWEMVRLSKQADVTLIGSSSVDSGRVGPVATSVARMASTDVLLVRRQPRVPYRKVVAAVDMSEASKAAVGAVLRRFPEAEITAVFSLPSRFDALLGEAGMFNEELTASRAQRLEEAELRMEEFVENWPGRVRPLVADGPPREAISEMVRRRGADLVSVASRGAGATRMVLLGSVAEEVAAEAPCDVFIARVSSQFRRP